MVVGSRPLFVQLKPGQCSLTATMTSTSMTCTDLGGEELKLSQRCIATHLRATSGHAVSLAVLTSGQRTAESGALSQSRVTARCSHGVSFTGPTTCQSYWAHNMSVLLGPQRVSLTGPTACQSYWAHSVSVLLGPA